MLTQKRLHEIIHYDPDTGIAVYKVALGGKAPVGGRVGGLRGGSKRSMVYRFVKFKELGKLRPFSHLVNFYMTGRWPKNEMDHVNRNTLDDRWVNLRESTRAQNEANRGPRKNNKLGIKGVCRMKDGKYQAQYWRGKRIYIGVFDDPLAAKAAISAALKKHDGEFFHP